MKRKFIPLIIIFYFTGCLLSYSQTVRVCGTSEYDKYLRSINPDYAKERDQMENKMADFNATHPLQKNTSGPIVIPVVVHIVYNTPEQNLSDDQIVSQIDVLNEDYSTSNANIVEVPSVWSHLVKNSGLTFRLARRDENGDSTSGITRRLTSMGFFSTDNAVKHYSSGGSDAWDRNHFLNIWVCNLDGSVLGYAQYPDHSSSTASTDGIVIGFESFGRIGNNLKPQYNLGRSATHEIGHWLNLVHIWGDADCGDDHVDDTPKQKTNTFGCPEVVHVSCNNGPNGDMFQNYMDYTDDKCMMLFTRLQIDRMIDALRMYRDSIYYQFAGIYANPIGTLATDLQISEIDTPSGIICKKNFNIN
ncbi:MAG: zinc metalloprotease, partial [Bacteroidota bacterium]